MHQRHINTMLRYIPGIVPSESSIMKIKLKDKMVKTLKIEGKKEQNIENFTSSTTSLAALVLQKPSSVNISDVLNITMAENHYNADLPLHIAVVYFSQISNEQ